MPSRDFSSSPSRGTNGQNRPRPNNDNAAGKAKRANSNATTRPIAAETPNDCVLGATLSTSTKSASTTVRLLATMASPEPRTAAARASR